MCSQKNSKALVPPPSGALPVRRVSSESATCVSHRASCGVDSSIPKQTPAENCSSAADSRDRPGPNRLWVSQDPGTAEARGLAGGQEAGVSAVPGRGSNTALQAAAAEMCGNESPGAL
jgi:hypothetical protein